MNYKRIAKELRTKLILSQEEFATFLGVSLYCWSWMLWI